MARGPAEIAHGQMFIGLSINILLCGIMITQVYLYGVTYRRDPKWIKTVVYLIFLADLMNTGLIFAYLYRSLITFYGQVEVLQQADWIFATDPALTGIIACCVQMFFAWRIKILTKSWILCSIIAAMAIAGGVAAVLTAWEIGRTPIFTEFRKFKATVIVWFATNVIGDFLITAFLVFYLHRTGFSGSNMMIDRVIRVTVQTGLITMIVVTVNLIVFLTDPTGTHLIFNFPLCKLYTNSLMSNLNSRKGWNLDLAQDQNSTLPSGDMEGSQGVTSGTAQVNSHANSNYRPPNIRSSGPGVQVALTTRPEVFVHVESHELVDVQTGARGQVQPGVVVLEKEKSEFHSSNSSLEGAENEKRWKGNYYAS